MSFYYDYNKESLSGFLSRMLIYLYLLGGKKFYFFLKKNCECFKNIFIVRALRMKVLVLLGLFLWLLLKF